MKVVINKADRLWKLPQPVLGGMHFTQKRLAARHVELIDLESFVPEIPPALSRAVNTGDLLNSVSDSELVARLAQKIAAKHFSLKSISLDPEKEIAITPGIRASAMMLSLGMLNPGDTAAYPDPGMPYIRTAICLADGAPRKYSLLENNDYIINISSFLGAPSKKIKILFINYPHDPTGATVDFYFYRELLKSFRSINCLIVADCAYIYPGNPDPAGPLQIKNATGKAVEFHSFATTLGLPGLGFAVGHKDVIAILKALFAAQGFTPQNQSLSWAVSALDHQEEAFQSRMEILKGRREILIEGLKELGWKVRSSRLTPFIWTRPEVHTNSAAFARRLYAKAGVKVAPGADFGEAGEGWLRLSLCCDEQTLSEALKRLAEHSKIWQRKYKPED
jgi:aspartate/methionine/tyrosine aminotransferase